MAVAQVQEQAATYPQQADALLARSIWALVDFWVGMCVCATRVLQNPNLI